MDELVLRRHRTLTRTAAAAAVASAMVLGLYALHAGLHPLVYVSTCQRGCEEDAARVAAANIGRTLGPIVGALLALAGTWAILKRPDRLGYALTFGAGLIAVYDALNLVVPPYASIGWDAILLVLGLAVLAGSVVGWFVSPPLPVGPPRYPAQHQAG